MNRTTRSNGSTGARALAASIGALALVASGCGTNEGDGVVDGGSGGGPTPPADFSVGAALHGVSVGANGTVRTWGSNAFGQLGDGTTTSSSSPAAVAGITTAVQVEAGRDFTIVRLADGSLAVFGENSHGQLGDGTTTASDVPIASTLSDVARVNLLGTSQTVLAQTEDGRLWSWGRNDLGQAGDGTTTDVVAPFEIAAAADALDFSAGEFHSLAVLDDGTVLAWGLNVAGQLGNGTNTSSTTPVAVSGITTATAVACGSSFSLALLADGTVMAWGENAFGALGDGSTTDSNVPVAVAGLTGVAKIDATSDSAIALKTDGTVWTWGGGGAGQLGNGTNAPSQTSPVQVTGLAGSTIVDVDGGDSAVLLIASDGDRFAFGENGSGVLGNGTTTDSNVAVSVIDF